MLGRLQNDFQQLSDFAADLAHEFRTPISNLLTQTQVTLSTQRDLKTYQDTLASNAEELQRLARVVSDMLLLAKTERGVDLPHKESFSAAQEARELVEFYEAVADEKRILMSVEGDGRIYGDRLMFRRAVSNLLSNALRHAPVGGVVSVRIESSSREIGVTVENTGKTGQAWGCRLPKPSSRPMAVRSRLRQTGSGHDSGLFFQSDGRRLKQPPELLNPHLTGPGLRPTPTVLKTAAI
jgi:two-component system heavy metal sensor histidine kinase CusS